MKNRKKRHNLRKRPKIEEEKYSSVLSMENSISSSLKRNFHDFSTYFDKFPFIILQKKTLNPNSTIKRKRK